MFSNGYDGNSQEFLPSMDPPSLLRLAARAIRWHDVEAVLNGLIPRAAAEHICPLEMVAQHIKEMAADPAELQYLWPLQRMYPERNLMFTAFVGLLDRGLYQLAAAVYVLSPDVHITSSNCDLYVRALLIDEGNWPGTKPNLVDTIRFFSQVRVVPLALRAQWLELALNVLEGRLDVVWEIIEAIGLDRRQVATDLSGHSAAYSLLLWKYFNVRAEDFDGPVPLLFRAQNYAPAERASDKDGPAAKRVKTEEN